MLDDELMQNTEISPDQKKILYDICLNLYVKLSTSDENARMSADIRDTIKNSAAEFYKAEQK